MKEILTYLFTIEHIKVNARNRKNVEKLIREREGNLDWVVWAIPALILIFAVIGFILAL